MRFKEIEPANLHESAFKIFNSDWTLITAGDSTKFNTMTASWGGIGVMWNKNVAYIVVRPTRYTYEFVEKSDRFTLSFFEEDYRDALNLCGTKSGRDIDKVKATGLTPVFDGGSVYFQEARLVMICKKLYWQDITPDNFLSPDIEQYYPKKDYHRLYVGEIENIYEKWVINPLDLQ
jgi:flavin reductase (DIM6/NTAB) family NADH-FMN oxidoreductase RutF